MSTQHEALRIADQLKERYGATVPTSQAAAMLRKQHELIVQMAEALKHARQVLNHNNLPLECAPINEAIAAAKDYLK